MFVCPCMFCFVLVWGLISRIWWEKGWTYNIIWKEIWNICICLWQSFDHHSVQLCTVLDGICALGKALLHSSSRWYLCTWKSPCALHPFSQRFPQCCLWNGSSVCLIYGVPLSSFQRRSLSACLFPHLSPLDVLMSLALCPWVVSKLLNTSDILTVLRWPRVVDRTLKSSC